MPARQHSEVGGEGVASSALWQDGINMPGKLKQYVITC
jgi:hypothetical protein